MSMLAGVPVSVFIFGLAFLVLFTTILLILRSYEDKLFSNPMATVAATLGLTVSMLCALAIPFDVLTAHHNTGIKDAYTILHTALAILAFGIIPFVYFYVASFNEEDDDIFGDDACETCNRIFGALKMTLISLALLAALIVLGLYLDPGERAVMNKEALKDVRLWLRTFATGPSGERALLLVIACLTCVGFVHLVMYTVYGVVMMPFNFVERPARVIDLESGEAVPVRSKQIKQQKKRYGVRRYCVMPLVESTDSASSAQASQVRAKVRALHTDPVVLNGQAPQDLDDYCAPTCTRIRNAILGVVFLAMALLSLLVISSLGVSLVDKALNSPCGFRCGFLLDSPRLFNPFDQLLLNLSPWFPADYMVLCGVIVFFFATSLYAVMKLGIRFMGFEVFEIKKQGTWPQALLMLALVIMLTTLAIVATLPILAPQFVTFGSQTYDTPAGKVPCSLTSSSATAATATATGAKGAKHSGTTNLIDLNSDDGPASNLPSQCVMSSISVFAHKLHAHIPVFAQAVFISCCAFVLFSFVGTLYKCKTSVSYALSLEDQSELAGLTLDKPTMFLRKPKPVPSQYAKFKNSQKY